MKNLIQNSFIKSDRVIRYKLNSKAADILDVLIYKHDYWKNERELLYIDGKGYFYISLNDLIAETGYSKNVIAKNINLLKRERLVHSIQQGLNKPNCYLIDKEAIDRYKDKYRAEFKKWQKDIRENTLLSSSKRKCKKSTSGIAIMSILDTSKEGATKNKNTKNKNTESNTTNRASSGSEIDLEGNLEKEIEILRCCDEVEKEVQVKSLFNKLCSLVPLFRGFSMSDDDKKLIFKMIESEIEEYKLASKITSNAFDIIEGRKESRFGSLFVGIGEMISNYNEILV